MMNYKLDNPQLVVDNSTNLPNKQKFEFSTAKKILFYTPFFTSEDYEFGFGHQPFLNHSCPVHNCFTTNNKSLLGDFLTLTQILDNFYDFISIFFQLLLAHRTTYVKNLKNVTNVDIFVFHNSWITYRMI